MISFDRMTASRFGLAASLVLATAGAAGAMPMTPATGSADHVDVIQVRGGCGFGEHRGPYGGCRINHGPRGAIRAEMTGLPRGCPPGLHRVYGVCR